MKKYFWMFLIIAFFGFSFAQETTTSWVVPENVVTPGETKIITQDLNSDNMTELQSTQARFCNDNEVTKFVALDIRPWQRKEICVVLGNISDKPVNVLLWFSAGTLNKDKSPVCDGDESNKNSFAKQILPSITTGITIPASGSIIQKFWYVAPKTASGTVLGCFGFKINKQEQIQPGKMFLIVPRKVGYIYMNVTGSVYNFGRRDDIKNTYTTNKQGILKVIIGVLAIWLILTVVQTGKKKEKNNKKK